MLVGGIEAPLDVILQSVRGVTTHADHVPRRQWASRSSAIAWVASCVALAVSTGGVAYATADELGYLVRVQLPTPPEVTGDVLVSRAEDAKGRRASFRILLFTDEFRWRLSSAEALDARPPRPTFTPEMKKVLNAAEEIIVVGTSSEEMPSRMSTARARALEERRAGRRAERIALWVREVLSQPIPVRKLNVGHHASTAAVTSERSLRARRAVARDTSDQRRLVIILVLEHEEGVDIDQALRAAMAEESVRAPIFETLLTRYSLTGGQEFTWVP
jgi:hypothetical protein